MKLRRIDHEILVHADAAEIDLSFFDRDEWAIERAGRIMDDSFLAPPARFAFRIERWNGAGPQPEGTVYVRAFRQPGEMTVCFEADFKAPMDFTDVAF